MNSYFKKILFLIAGLTILGVLIAIALYSGQLRFNYPSYSKFPVRGIDVSNHQNDIIWEEIDNMKISFVFIKATEGGDFKDKSFIRNWEGAKKQNLRVGAYHFFTFCKSGEEQAKNFIESVPKDSFSLPPVIDLEFGGNCKMTKTDEEVINEIMILEKELNEHFNKKPILYVTQEFYKRFLVNKFKNSPIWIRAIYDKPKLQDDRKWLFWQYGNRGRIKGINTFVDLNVFNGSRTEFEELLKYQIENVQYK